MKPSKKERFIYGITTVLPLQFIDIAKSIVGILTLGYYVPSWSFVFMAKMSRRRLQKTRKKDNA